MQIRFNGFLFKRGAMLDFFIYFFWDSFLWWLTLWMTQKIVPIVTFGKCTCEDWQTPEGKARCAAGALSFVKDGQCVITRTGQELIGLFLFLALIGLVVLLCWLI